MRQARCRRACAAWAWWICGLLMLATVVNYMDRQVLSVTAKRIKSDLDFNNRYYGWLETGFGIAFAAGQILLGFVSDRVNLRWFYPLLLALWSLVGFATGLMHSFTGLLVYFACCLLTACATFAAFLPAGPWLVGVLLLVGCGSLGSFPFYYALSQELSRRHQGQIIGVMGASAWLTLSLLHPLFGSYIDATRSFDRGLALIGWVPLLSCAVLWRFWPGSRRSLQNPSVETVS